jgi:hypothetical protein
MYECMNVPDVLLGKDDKGFFVFILTLVGLTARRTLSARFLINIGLALSEAHQRAYYIFAHPAIALNHA